MSRIFGIKREGKSLTLTSEAIRHLVVHYEEEGHLRHFVQIYLELTRKPGKGKNAKKPQFTAASYVGTALKISDYYDAAPFEKETGSIVISDPAKFAYELQTCLRTNDACEPRSYTEDLLDLIGCDITLEPVVVPITLTVEVTMNVELEAPDRASATDLVAKAVQEKALSAALSAQSTSSFEEVVLDAMSDDVLPEAETTDGEIALKSVKIG